MDSSQLDPLGLMLEVIREHTRQTIWTDAPLESFRQVANTNRGDIGEEFVRRYLAQHDIEVSEPGSRVSPFRHADIRQAIRNQDRLGGQQRQFQFNHVRLDRPYEYLLCLGVRPASILFNAWRKGDVSEGKAGTLVRMAEGQSVTFKLTKRPDTMLSIAALPTWVRGTLGVA